MIYILKQSKKMKYKKTRYQLTVSEAIEFFYNLSPRAITLTDFVIIGATNEQELMELFTYFVDGYFVKTSNKGFESDAIDDVYIASEHFTKYNKTNFAPVSIIKGLKGKINESLSNYKTSLNFAGDYFEIVVETEDKIFYRFKYKYSFELKDTEIIFNAPQHVFNLSEIQEIARKLEQVFQMQKYYYTRKED